MHPGIIRFFAQSGPERNIPEYGRKEKGDGRRLSPFSLAALVLDPAAAGGLRLFSRFFFPCPAREPLLILEYIHKMDGKK